MDEIAEMFGAKPNLLKYWCTDPRLAYSLLFDGMAPYQFRLNVRLNFNKIYREITFVDINIYGQFHIPMKTLTFCEIFLIFQTLECAPFAVISPSDRPMLHLSPRKENF